MSSYTKDDEDMNDGSPEMRHEIGKNYFGIEDEDTQSQGNQGGQNMNMDFDDKKSSPRIPSGIEVLKQAKIRT